MFTRWRERWASQWRWWITAQVGESFALLNFLTWSALMSTERRTEGQNVIWINNRWLIYKKENSSWSCRNDTAEQNCKLNICEFSGWSLFESNKQIFGQYPKIISQCFFITFLKLKENHNERQGFLTNKVYMHIYPFSSLRDIIVILWCY